MQKFKNKQIVYVNSPYNIAEKCEATFAIVDDYGSSAHRSDTFSEGVHPAFALTNKKETILKKG